MKADIHPTYNAVVFRDLASGATFLTRSTVSSDKTIELDGETYPVIDVEIVESHPFYGQAAHHGLGRPRREVQQALQELRRVDADHEGRATRSSALRRAHSHCGRASARPTQDSVDVAAR